MGKLLDCKHCAVPARQPSNPSSLYPYQSQLPTSPVDLLQPSGQQQLQCSADEASLKRLEKDIPSAKESWQPLSEENLQIHNRLRRSALPFDMGTFSKETQERKDHKRSASRQSSVSEMIIESTTVSQRLPGSDVSSRWRILGEMGISVSSEPLIRLRDV